MPYISKFACKIIGCDVLSINCSVMWKCDAKQTSVPAGILPPHSDSHTLVGGYRKGQYQDILEALEVMRYINSSTPSTHIYLRMFQLESQVLPRCSETSAPVRWSTPRVILSHLRLIKHHKYIGWWWKAAPADLTLWSKFKVVLSHPGRIW